MIPKSFRGILYFGNMHKANARGLHWLSQKCHFPVFQVNDLPDALRYAGFWLILAVDSLVPNTIPGKLIVSGPHLFLADYSQENTQDVVFNCLAPWVQNLVRHIHPHLQTIAAPFPVPYDEFVPSHEPKTHILLYVKYRPPDVGNQCYDIIQQVFPDEPLEMVAYLQYDMASWKKNLDRAKLVVFLVSTESQGFAIQEAMCCDVPILLFDVKTVAETFFGPEKKTRWFDHPGYKQPILGTAKNLWDDKCGEHITDLNQLKATLLKMKANLAWYHPRQIIVDQMSPEKCLNRLLAVPGWSPHVHEPIVIKEKKFTECVVVCSCVHTADTPLCYAPRRSVFSHETRFQQLLHSLDSVQTCLPHADVFLAEASELTEDEQNVLRDKYPKVQVRLLHDDPDVNRQRDSPYKGATEMYMLSALWTNIQKYDFLRKLSGRYELTPQVQEWPEFPLKTQYYHKNKSTVCYGVPRALYANFAYRLQVTIQMCKNAHLCVENVLFFQVPETLSIVGVQGVLFNGDPLSL
jgi:hypothetical protein